MLTKDACDAALGCVTDDTSPAAPPNAALCAQAMQPNFLCSWQPSEQLTNWTRLVFPRSMVKSASCVRHACPLEQYARGVALEFGLIFLTLCYVSSFALHDVRRLLDRPPPEARLATAPECRTSDAREPLQIFAPPAEWRPVG